MAIRYAGLAAALAAALSGVAAARDGDLDSSFGTGGKVVTAYPTGQFIDIYNVDLAVQPDGKLLVAASRDYEDPDYDFGVMRLLPDGSLDTAFGPSGASYVWFDRDGSDKGDHVVGIALQPDGKIVLVGYVDGDPLTGQDMGIVRLNADGSTDSGFGTSGKTLVQFNLGDCANSGCDDRAVRVNLQADGKILAVGQASSNPGPGVYTSSLALVRLTTTGQRDATFDADGRVTLGFGGDVALGFRAKQLADGAHIVVVGGATTTAAGTNIDFAVARLNDNGSLDATFGVGGKATYGFDLGGDLGDIATDFVELPDGKLLVCGEVRLNSPQNFDFGCVRFLANGVPDASFSPVVVPFDLGGGFQDAPLRVERDAQGRIVLAGVAERATNNYDFAAARLLPSGALDTTFGRGGIATYDTLPLISPDATNMGSGLALQADGRIVIAGYAYSTSSGDPKFQVVRVIGDTIFAYGFESD
jgi:uncharacterized delta-60 repeat protein